jgi:hypothetical protein
MIFEYFGWNFEHVTKTSFSKNANERIIFPVLVLRTEKMESNQEITASEFDFERDI